MPIDYTAWPQPADVQRLLVACDFWPTPSQTELREAALIQAEIALNATVADFEQRTGWIPFLSDGESDTRTFDGTDADGMLQLGGGVISVSSITVQGSALTTGNYWLRRSDSLKRRYPYDMIQFRSGVQAGAVSLYPDYIVVTGVWGYCSEAPPDVWNAVLQKAAASTLYQLIDQPNVAAQSEDGFSEEFDQVGPMTPFGRADRWEKEYAAVAQRYMRVVC